MKTKLLKKIRKRYLWYFNKQGYPVLIDKKKQTAKLYDLEYLMQQNNYTWDDVQRNVQVLHTEWAIRHLKSDILFQYGWNYNRVIYRLAMRRYENRLKPKTKKINE